MISMGSLYPVRKMTTFVSIDSIYNIISVIK